MKLIGRRLSVWMGGKVNILVEKRVSSYPTPRLNKTQFIFLEDVYDILGDIVYKPAGIPVGKVYGLTIDGYILDDDYWLTQSEYEKL